MTGKSRDFDPRIHSANGDRTFKEMTMLALLGASENLGWAFHGISQSNTRFQSPFWFQYIVMGQNTKQFAEAVEKLVPSHPKRRDN